MSLRDSYNLCLSSDEDDATLVVRSRAAVSKSCSTELEDVDFSKLCDGHQSGETEDIGDSFTDEHPLLPCNQHFSGMSAYCKLLGSTDLSQMWKILLVLNCLKIPSVFTVMFLTFY